MTVMLGGPKARAQYVSRGIVVSMQYVNDEPAMVLFPKHSLHAGAFIICLSSAWKYQEHEYLVQQAAIAATQMGLGSDRGTVYRVATVINNYLEELVKMKPEPDSREAAPAVGEGEILLPSGASLGRFEIH